MDKETLIEKWLNNDLSVEEQKAFESLDDHDQLTKIVESASKFKASNFSEPKEYKQLESQLFSSKKVESKKRFVVWKIAAALVVLVGIAYFLLNNPSEVTNTLASQKTSVTLPDASTVALNASSKLEYNISKWEDKREVKLKGEAYFKVAKGSSFNVITPNGTVRVVGTQFNVKQRSDYFEVSCFEGIVEVISKDMDVQLNAGDVIRIIDNQTSRLNTTNASPIWTKDQSNFESIPFKYVIIELEQQYDITIDYDKKLEDLLFNGGFIHTNLDVALKSITEPLDLTIKETKNNHIVLTSRED